MPRRWLRWASLVAVLTPMLLTMAGTRGFTGVFAQEATPAASPVAESPGEPGPAFVSGQWRIALVAADRSPGINALSLERGAGRTWIVVVADITNWSPNSSTLNPRELRLFFPEESNPGGFAPESTLDVAARLGTEPRLADAPITYNAEETKRVSVAFQVSQDFTVPALRLGDEALSLDDLLKAEVDFTALPPVTPAPTLDRVLIDDIIAGNELEVFSSGQGENQRITLIGVEAPTGNACYAAESTAALSSLTASAVLIERDPTAGDGSNGAVPRYAWIQNEDGQRTLLNRVLLVEGAGVWAGEPANTRFAEWLQQADRIARETNAGLWEACGGLEDPLEVPVASPTAEAEEAEPVEEGTPEATEEATTEEATAEATEETEAAAEVSPEATTTDIPVEEEPAATLEPAGQYPPSVAELAAEDDPGQCDRIGWGTPSEDEVDEEQVSYYAACHEAGGVYIARCVGSAEGTGSVRPAADRLWIVCVVIVANDGDDALFVSPVDFVLIDGDNRRYELNSVAMEALPDDRVLQSGEIAPDERISGAVAFDVPRNGTRPFRVEIVPLVESNASTSQPAVIIIDPEAQPPGD